MISFKVEIENKPQSLILNKMKLILFFHKDLKFYKYSGQKQLHGKIVNQNFKSHT